MAEFPVSAPMTEEEKAQRVTQLRQQLADAKLQKYKNMVKGEIVTRVSGKSFGFGGKKFGIIAEVRETQRYRVVTNATDIGDFRAGWWFELNELDLVN